MSFSSVRSSSLLPSSTASNNYSTFAPSAEPMNLVCPPDSPTGSDATLDSLVHFRKTDYRGFLFVNHEKHGLVLLHCTRKQKKGSHYQLPGGHVDDAEFLQAGACDSLCTTCLLNSLLQLVHPVTEIHSCNWHAEWEQSVSCMKRLESICVTNYRALTPCQFKRKTLIFLKMSTRIGCSSLFT